MKTRDVTIDGVVYRFAKPTLDACEAAEDFREKVKKDPTSITDRDATASALDFVSSALKRAGSAVTYEDLRRQLDQEQLQHLYGEVLRFSFPKELPPGEPLSP